MKFTIGAAVAWALPFATVLLCFVLPPASANAQGGACCNIACEVNGSDGQCYFVNNFGDCWCLPGQGNLTEGCRPVE